MILLIQDTTSISYGNRKAIEGMGYYCDSAQRGMLVHSCIAVTDTGIPVGLLFQEAFTRIERKDSSQTKEQKKLLPIEKKESFRWISFLRQIHEKLPSSLKRLTVCDREGDFYELFSDAEELGEKFLIRLTQNRLTQEGKKLFDVLKNSDVKGSMVLQIGRNAKEHLPSRKVKMDYHYEKITIRKPTRRNEDHLKDSLALTGIYIHETVPKEHLQWFLITNEEITTAKDAEKQIKNYVRRWTIERFHYVLKSGCKIEEKQARSYEKLRMLTVLYSVIALQILNLTFIGKVCPEMPIDNFLDETEWKVLYCAARKTHSIPTKGYCVGEAVYDLAVLGGRKGALSDGIPGVQAVWKGLFKLYTLLSYREYLI